MMLRSNRFLCRSGLLWVCQAWVLLLARLQPLAALDPCASVANTFAQGMPARPSQVAACLDSFPFSADVANATLDTISVTLGAYVFQTVGPTNLPAALARMRASGYPTERAFHDAVRRLFVSSRDSHLGYSSLCFHGPFSAYLGLPVTLITAPSMPDTPQVIVSSVVEQMFVDPSIWPGVDLASYSGAVVKRIGALDPLKALVSHANSLIDYAPRDYASRLNLAVARYTWADDGVSSYSHIDLGSFSSRSGSLPSSDTVSFRLRRVGRSKDETVQVPWSVFFNGDAFGATSPQFYANNCALPCPPAAAPAQGRGVRELSIPAGHAGSEDGGSRRGGGLLQGGSKGKGRPQVSPLRGNIYRKGGRLLAGKLLDGVASGVSSTDGRRVESGRAAWSEGLTKRGRRLGEVGAAASGQAGSLGSMRVEERKRARSSAGWGQHLPQQGTRTRGSRQLLSQSVKDQLAETGKRKGAGVEENIGAEATGRRRVALVRRTPLAALYSQLLQAYMLPDGVTGVIVVPTFDIAPPAFANKLKACIAALQGQNATQLILDMRGNLGGRIPAGFHLINILFPGLGNPSPKYAFSGSSYTQRLVLSSLQKFGPDYCSMPTTNGCRFWYGNWLEQNLDPISEAKCFYFPTQTQRLQPAKPGFAGTQSFSQPVRQKYSPARAADQPAPFSPDSVLVLTDGYCASICAVVVYLLKAEMGVRTVFNGGISTPQGASRWAGVTGAAAATNPGGGVITLNDLLSQEVGPLGESSDPDQPQPFVRRATLSFTVRAAMEEKSGHPMEFNPIPADYRVYATPDNLDDIQRAWKDAATFF